MTTDELVMKLKLVCSQAVAEWLATIDQPLAVESDGPTAFYVKDAEGRDLAFIDVSDGC